LSGMKTRYTHSHYEKSHQIKLIETAFECFFIYNPTLGKN